MYFHSSRTVYLCVLHDKLFTEGWHSSHYQFTNSYSRSIYINLMPQGLYEALSAVAHVLNIVCYIHIKFHKINHSTDRL